MSSVDKRVVEMSFDNKQFESGVKTTMSTLDKLKERLKFSDSSSGLSKLQSSVRSFSLDGIASGVDNISNKFSALGVIGFTVLQNLTNSAINAGKKMISSVTSPIFEGGWQRATNIENAKFQVAGLGYEWDQVKDQISFAVNETAYGLDSAATAASQLLSSGVKVGETFNADTGEIDDMGRALRGISGVAAMTNSSYEDISRIFTTVAGNGRLMGDQLLQLSGRGLNAAATLKDYFNGINDGSIKATDSVTEYVKTMTDGMAVTEQDVRELVSGGLVNFELFSNAMYDTFGEHAVKANETFNGAMSNVRAALKKIGAEFATPLIATENKEYNLIGILNAYRLKINEVKKALTPLYEVWADIVKVAGSFIVDTINNLDLSFFGRWAEDASKLWEEFKKSSIAKDSLYIIKSLLTEIGIVARPLKAVISDMFPKVTVQTVGEFVNGIAKAVANFRLMQGATGYQTYQKLAIVLRGVLTVVKMVVQAFKAFAQAASPITDRLKGIASWFLDIAVKASEFVQDFSKWADHVGLFSKIAEVAVSGVVKVMDGLRDGVGFLISKFEELTGIDIHFPTFQEVATAIAKLSKNVYELYLTAKDRLAEAFEVTAGAVLLFIDALGPVGDTVKSIFKGVTDSIKNFEFGDVLETASGIISKIADFIAPVGGLFVGAANGVAKFFNAFSKKNTKDAEDSINVLQGITDGFKKAWEIIDKIAGKIVNVGKKIGSGLMNALAKMDFKKVLDVGLLGVLAEVLTTFGIKIQQILKRLDKTTTKAKSIVGSISGTLAAVKNTLVAYQKELKAESLLKIAAAIAVLAVSLIALTTIDPESLSTAVAAIGALFAYMYGAMAVMDKTTTTGKLPIFNTMSDMGSTMIKLSAAVLVLTVALKQLSGISWDDIGKGLTGIIGMTVILVAAVEALNLIKPRNLTKTATAMVIFSAGLLVLAQAIKSMGKIDYDTMAQGLIGLAVALTEIMVFVSVAGEAKHIKSTAVSLVVISSALLILSKAIESMGSIDTVTMAKGLLAMGIALGEIAIAVGVMPKNMISIGTGMVLLSASMLILSSAIKSIGSIDTVTLGKGLLGLGIALGEIAIAVGIMPKNMPAIAIGMIGISAAIVILSGALQSMGSMSGTEIAASLVELGGSLLIITAVLVALSNASVLAGAAALVVVSAALSILAPVLQTFGSMSIGEVITSLVVLAGALTVLGVAGALLAGSGITLALIGLGAAITLIGVGVMAAGAGLILLASGITALGLSLAASSAGIVASIGIIVEGILGMIPIILEGLGAGIASFFKMIAVSGSALIEAITVIIMALIVAIERLVPAIVQVGMELLLALLAGMAQNIYQITAFVAVIIVEFINALADYLDVIIDAGINLMVSFIDGMANGIRDNQEKVFAAVRNLIGAIIEFALSALQEIAKEIPVIGDKIASDLEVVKSDVRERFSPAEFEDVGSQIPEGVSKGIRSGKKDVENASKELADTSDKALRKTYKGSFNAGEQRTEQFNKGALSKKGETTNASKEISNLFNQQLTDGAGLTFGIGDLATGNFLDGTLSNLTDSQNAGKLFSSTNLDGINSNLNLFGQSGDSASNEYISSFLSNKDLMKQAGIDLPQEALDSLNSKQGDFLKSGDSAGANYGTGMYGEKPFVDSASEALVSTASSNLSATAPGASTGGTNTGNSYASSLRNTSGTAGSAARYIGDVVLANLDVSSEASGIGSNVTLGFAQGINKSSVISAVQAAAASSGHAATNTLRASVAVASPSKIAIWIGEMFTTGFANGIANLTGRVKSSSEEVGQTAIDSMSDKLSDIADSVSTDFEPTITPVLDLSEIQNGANSINGLFANQSVNLSGANNGLFNANRALQQSYNVENSNKSVVEEITRLRSDVGTLSNYISKLRLVLDSGALVGGIIDPIDTELGKRQILAGRGI